MNHRKIDRTEWPQEAAFHGRPVYVGIVHGSRIEDEEFFRSLRIVRMIVYEIHDKIAVPDPDDFILMEGYRKVFELEDVAPCF